jgi:TolB-like protein/Tfp pilus assembly protein PilF
LSSWKEIASYLRISVRTAQRWERIEDLPVHRHEHAGSSTVFAYTSELEVWLEKRKRRMQPIFRRAALIFAACLAVAAILIFLRSPAGIVKPGEMPSIRSIAVLPLMDLSTASDQDHLAMGITAQLTAELARNTALTVISQTSTPGHPNMPTPVSEVAKMLNADAVLEGSLQRTGDRLHINLRMVRAGGAHVWTASYDQHIKDVLVMQSEIVRSVAEQLKVQKAESLSQSRAVSAVVPEAYEAYLKGRFVADHRDVSRLPTAVRYLEQAVRLDPQFALAWAVLAEREGWISYALDLPLSSKILKEMRKAIQLDDRLAEAHVNVGDLEFYWNWDWSKGEAEFRRAVQLDPGSSDALLHYALCLSALGHDHEAIETMQRARRVEPLSPHVLVTLGGVLNRARRSAEAIEYFQKALDLDPNYSEAYLGMAAALGDTGDTTGAVAQSLKAEELRGMDRNEVEKLRRTFAGQGYQALRAELFHWKLASFERKARLLRVSPRAFASVHAALDNREEALQWLEEAYRQRCPSLAWLKTNREWDSLRSDPRFQTILTRMRFPQ